MSHDEECSHLFHKICISEWLLTNQDCCPICRRNFLDVTTTAAAAAQAR
jgi:RING-H2 zinc finger domain